MLNVKEGRPPLMAFSSGCGEMSGCCGLAPVMMVNGEIHGKVKREEVATILSKYKKEG